MVSRVIVGQLVCLLTPGHWPGVDQVNLSRSRHRSGLVERLDFTLNQSVLLLFIPFVIVFAVQ